MHIKNHLIIDLNIISQNYKKIKQLTKSEISAIVKADAYGLGATNIVLKLKELGCSKYFVANIEEALELRKNFNDIDIFVFNGNDKINNIYFYKNRITPVINSMEQLKIWSEFSILNNQKLDAILHIDTGINRYGMVDYEIEEIKNDSSIISAINIKYILSHLASSEIENNEYNLFQLKNLKKYKKYFPNIPISFANSGGIFLGEDFHFDLVRAGAALYGLGLNEKMSIVKNPISLFSNVIQLKNLKKGEKIGYNSTCELKRDSIIATVPVGYADGIFRSLSNSGKFFIEGYAASIVGNVSMDYVNIDVSDVPRDILKIGCEVEILGRNQSPNDLAKDAKTIGYEIITSLGNRYERIYV